MANCVMSFRVFLIVLAVSHLVNAVTHSKEKDFSSEIANLKNEFQHKVDYLFQIIKEKDEIHAREIATLQRQVDILYTRCGTEESSSSKTNGNATVAGTGDDVTLQQSAGRSSEHEHRSGSRDRGSSLTYQRSARVDQGYRKHVAFYSYLTSVTNPGVNHAIIFDHVVTNLADSYNAKSGVFHCGVPGVYVFNVHILSNLDKQIYTVVAKNGATVSYVYAGSGTYEHGGNTVVLELAVGDEVVVKSVAGTQAGAALDGVYCTFSGFLLYPY